MIAVFAGSLGVPVEIPTSTNDEKISVSIGRMESVPVLCRRASMTPMSGAFTVSPSRSSMYRERAVAASSKASSYSRTCADTLLPSLDVTNDCILKSAQSGESDFETSSMIAFASPSSMGPFTHATHWEVPAPQRMVESSNKSSRASTIMASQGVREEISTHHPSAVFDNAIRIGLTIEAKDGFALFEFGSGLFIMLFVLKKSPVLCLAGLVGVSFECLLRVSDLLPHWDLRCLSK